MAYADRVEGIWQQEVGQSFQYVGRRANIADLAVLQGDFFPISRLEQQKEDTKMEVGNAQRSISAVYK